MTSAPPREVRSRLLLPEKKAATMMTPSPVSIGEGASIGEAIELLTRREISGAPVIDEAGRPVGVISRGDILIHDREATDEERSTSRVRDLMTPVVFCISPDAPASRVVRELVELKVHRLFVVDDPGTLVGVITVLDVLRHLAPA